MFVVVTVGWNATTGTVSAYGVALEGLEQLSQHRPIARIGTSLLLPFERQFQIRRRKSCDEEEKEEVKRKVKVKQRGGMWNRLIFAKTLITYRFAFDSLFDALYHFLSFFCFLFSFSVEMKHPLEK